MSSRISALILLLLLISKHSKSQDTAIHWVSVEYAFKEARFDPKPIFIYFYTTSCGWCRKMEEQTLTHPKIISNLNSNYYAVKFLTQSRDTVVAFDHTFTNQQLRKYSHHDFALSILKGGLLFPTCTFFDVKQNHILNAKGYRKVKEFEALLVYLKNESYIEHPNFDLFLKTFKSNVDE